MHQLVNVAAHQFLAGETKGVHRQTIDEGAVPFQIQPPDAFAGRVQQRLPLLHLPFSLWYRHGHLVHFHLQT